MVDFNWEGLEGLLYSSRAGGRADALVDRECLPQVRRGFAAVAVVEVAAADAFQGACFLLGGDEVAGDGQGLVMVAAGLLGV